MIAKAITARKDDKAKNPLAVIACENMIGATTTLKNFITDEKNMSKEVLSSLDGLARFANSAIDRIVPAQDPDAGLNVTIESFFEWVVEETPWEPDHKHPDIQGVKWVRDLTPFIERKLFTVNTGHATAAYFGHNRKIPTIHQSVEDGAISKQIRAALSETSELIVKKHGIGAKEQEEYREKIIKRFLNPELKDSVDRVGRAPLRKLGRKERFVGPAYELAEMGASVDALLASIEMAFRFQNVEGDDESKELAQILAENEPKAVVEKVCGLAESDKLFPLVLKVVQKVKA